MNQKKRKYPPNCFRVCIDDAEVDIKGRFYSPLLEGESRFVEFRQVILQMDALFDRTGYPQSFQEKRSFRAGSVPGAAYSGIPETETTYEELQPYEGRLATLDVAVISRRNASWQGAVFSREGEKIGEYDGEWGLIDMIQKYLQKLKGV